MSGALATRQRRPEGTARCGGLHLPTVASRASALSAEALRQGESHLSFLAAVLEAELEDRSERRRHRRIAEAHFPRLKRLEDFRFDEAPRIPAARVRELATSTRGSGIPEKPL